MTNEQIIKSNIAIHSGAAGTAAIGAGLAQIPGSDNLPIVAIQITMAIALGRIFHVEVSEGVARGMVMTALATMTGPIVARVISQIVLGWVPGAGNAVNSATAAAFTEAVGWILVSELDKQPPEEPPAAGT
jgi:uncharacterized protein (DUF697 family)